MTASVKHASVRTLFELHPESTGRSRLERPLRLDQLAARRNHVGKPISSVQGRSCRPIAATAKQGPTVTCRERGANRGCIQAGSDARSPVNERGRTRPDIPARPRRRRNQMWAIAGPIIADLRMSIAGNNTDLFVQVADLDTKSKELKFLTRGWLKASHRAIDEEHSDYSSSIQAARDFMYRPFRQHNEPVDVPPSEPIDYKIEVWPTAHVFRPGHQLVVIVTAPPAVDSNYSFAAQSNQPASINTVFYNDPNVTPRR